MVCSEIIIEFTEQQKYQYEILGIFFTEYIYSERQISQKKLLYRHIFTKSYIITMIPDAHLC